MQPEAKLTTVKEQSSRAYGEATWVRNSQGNQSPPLKSQCMLTNRVSLLVANHKSCSLSCTKRNSDGRPGFLSHSPSDFILERLGCAAYTQVRCSLAFLFPCSLGSCWGPSVALPQLTRSLPPVVWSLHGPGGMVIRAPAWTLETGLTAIPCGVAVS